METIFDFNPTEKELQELMILNIDKKLYLQTRTKEGVLYDLALLFEERNSDKSLKYWAKIPKRYTTYMGQFTDNIMIPISED